jgi:hypothetical protein
LPTGSIWTSPLVEVRHGIFWHTFQRDFFWMQLDDMPKKKMTLCLKQFKLKWQIWRFLYCKLFQFKTSNKTMALFKTFSPIIILLRSKTDQIVLN